MNHSVAVDYARSYVRYIKPNGVLVGKIMACIWNGVVERLSVHLLIRKSRDHLTGYKYVYIYSIYTMHSQSQPSSTVIISYRLPS